MPANQAPESQRESGRNGLNRTGLKWGLPVALLAACLSGAVQATDDAALAEACRGSDEAARIACGHYVAGFLDGALLTDEAVLVRLSQDGHSDFMERAYRTRVGESRAPLPATALADFCLPDGVSTDEASRSVVDALLQSAGTGRTLQDRVYAAVKRLYSCETSSGG